MGYVSDWVNIYTPLLCSTLGSSVIVALVWGFSETLAPLVAFSLLYGSVAGGYNTLYSRFVTSLTKDPATGLWVYSMLELQRGVGNIVGGLVTAPLVRGEIKNAYGMGRYQNLILGIGAAFLISSLGVIGWFLDRPVREKSEKTNGEVTGVSL